MNLAGSPQDNILGGGEPGRDVGTIRLRSGRIDADPKLAEAVL
jgi:hypothetical protein